jgi:hypothetical protein
MAVAATTLAAWLIANPNIGAAQQPADEPAPETEVLDEQPQGTVIDRSHAGASDRVRRIGAWVDRFFADENYEAEVNKSRLRIRLDSFSELYEGTEPDAKVRLNLSLPALSKRIRFEFLSPGEPDDLEGDSGEASSQPQPGAVEEKTSAAVSYFIKAVRDRSFIVRLAPACGAQRRLEFPLHAACAVLFDRRAGIANLVRFRTRA